MKFLMKNWLLVCLVASATFTAVSATDDVEDDRIVSYELLAAKIEQALGQIGEQAAVNEQQAETIKRHAALIEEQSKLIEELGNRVQKLELQTSGDQVPTQDWQEPVANLEKKLSLQEAVIDKLKTPDPKTCDGIRQSDKTKESGMYWIDPDGPGQGDPPIYVFCNMTTGTTSVLHDSDESTHVGHCKAPGCYSHPVKYNATMKQMMSLIQQSVECRQLIQYECFGAPMEFNGVTYSWWNDRHGEPQYFWAGSGELQEVDPWVMEDVGSDFNRRDRLSRTNRNSSNNSPFKHTCQCGIDEDCIDLHVTCNCDSYDPQLLVDSGYVTNKTLLPVTKLNFGRTASKSSSGRHTLGYLECSGSLPFQGLPGSCEDLKRIGHQFSGFYDVHKNSKMETVYCDMSKLPGDKELQTLMRSSVTPVYFYVQRSSSFSQQNSVVPFEIETLNIGNAMNIRTGIFTAPMAGVYYFAFSGRTYHYNSNYEHQNTIIKLYQNNDTIASTYGYHQSEHETLALSSMLKLKTGDQIKLFLNTGTISDDSGKFTNFVGMLLYETD